LSKKEKNVLGFKKLYGSEKQTKIVVDTLLKFTLSVNGFSVVLTVQKEI